MKFADTTNTTLKPSPHYKFIAKRAQKYGVQVAPDDFETIDAWIDAINDWKEVQKKRRSR
jgi:hypothetical protein